MYPRKGFPGKNYTPSFRYHPFCYEIRVHGFHSFIDYTTESIFCQYPALTYFALYRVYLPPGKGLPDNSCGGIL